MGTSEVGLPPTTNSPLIPPLLPLPPRVIDLLRLSKPPNPLCCFPFRGCGSITFQEALLQRPAYHLLLLHTRTQPLIQRRRREWRQRSVHIRLFLSPLPLQRMRSQQLRLRSCSQVNKPCLYLVQMCRQGYVLFQRILQRLL